jgi:hypothetical protein
MLKTTYYFERKSIVYETKGTQEQAGSLKDKTVPDRNCAYFEKNLHNLKMGQWVIKVIRALT